MRIPIEEVQRREKLVESWYAESPFLTYAEINERLKGQNDLTMAPTTLSKIKNRMMTRIARGTLPRHLKAVAESAAEAAEAAEAVAEVVPAELVLVSPEESGTGSDLPETEPASVTYDAVSVLDSVKTTGEHLSMVTIAVADAAKSLSVALSACAKLEKICSPDSHFGKQALAYESAVQEMLEEMTGIVQDAAKNANIALTLIGNPDPQDLKDLERAVDSTKVLADPSAA